MATTFAIVDADLSTVLLNLNVGVASSGLTLYQDIDLGTIGAGSTIIDAPPSSPVAATDRNLVRVRFRLHARHTSADNLVTLARSLGTYLDKPSIYKVQLDGESSARYFDAIRADIPGLLRGQDLATHKIATLLMDPDGLPVELLRRPYFFGALVTESAAVIKNDPASGTNPKFKTVTVSGNMPTRAIIKVAPEAGASLVQARIGRRSYGSTDYRTSWYQEAENGTLTNSASFTDTGNATGNDALDLFTASETNFGKRVRLAFTGTTALEGTFRILGRVKVPASNTVRLQARWAPGNTTSLIANEVVTITMPAGVSSQYAVVDLGTASVEANHGTTYGVAVEIWAAQDSGSSVVGLDWVGLWPIGPTPDGLTDQSILLSVPGWRDQSGRSHTTYQGSELVEPTFVSTFTSGTVAGGIVKLNDVDDTDAAGIPPVAGIIYPAGEVRVKARVRLIAAAQDQTLGTLKVRASNNAGSLAAGSYLTQTTPLTAHNRDATKTFELTFTAQGSPYAYQPFVVADSIGTDAAEIRVQWMSTEVIPTVGTGAEMVSSGEYGHVRGRPAAYLTASGVHLGALVQEGAFIDLYPGRNDLFYDWGEAPSAGFETADPRGPLALSTIDRNCTVTVSYYPRYSA